MRLSSRLASFARGSAQRAFGSVALPRAIPRRGYVAGGATLAFGMALFNDEAKAAPAVDYNAVRAAIANILENDNWDDGSLGPVLVRLAWHASGTYNKADGTGGSDGATMRFAPEKDDGANAGLNYARDFLEPIKAQFPAISYADLWILAGVVAIEEMGGPKIGFRAGRTDKGPGQCPPVGRLPDATKGAQHLRDVFGRMGFNDQEIVALSGAHTLGRCHPDRSGFVNPWTRAPTTFSSEFFRELLDNTWTPKKWKGPPQFEDPTGELMMLPTDLVLIQDPAFRPWVVKYKNDRNLFFKDFAAAYQKLNELGVKFPQGEAQCEGRSGRFWLIAFVTAVGFATVSK